MNLSRHIYIKCFLLGVFTLCFFTKHVSGQNTFGSEEELKKQAKKMFSNAEFVSAYPLYSQLLSLYPKDPNFNYRFGVCMLYATEDKEKPITYLEFASTREGVDAEVFYYLAKAYHLNYRFDDAINTFNKFKARVSVTQVLKLQVDWQIKMCSNGKKLLRTISDLAVFEKKDLNKGEFFRSYDLPNIGGKLLVKPDEFKSDLDGKKNETSIIFLSQKNEVVYYSSFGKNEKRGKDIYMSKKLPTGEWSEGAPLSSAINTEYDEDFPFLHPNGKVLYFSSKGHNSMGGYDIFKSVLNENTGEWTEPLNLDFAINSPDDDILYVTDEAEQIAYFSSTRSSTDGMISVYKIKVDRKPVDISVIKGVYAKTAGETNLGAKITVKNLDNNELVGTFDTDPITGEYLLNLPNGGKFLFTVSSDGFGEQQEVVVVPSQSELKPLKQEIGYEAAGKLVVKNIFDESADDSGYLLALKFIKERAKMEVNSSESQEAVSIEPKVLTPPIDTASVKVGKIKESLSNSDIVKIAFEDAREVENDSKELIQQANMALSIASQKNELSQSKYKEAELIVNNSSGLENQIQKQAEIDKSNLLKEEAGKLAKETVAAFNLAQKLEADQKDKQQEADLSMKYAAELEAAIKSNSSQDALKQLDVQKNRLESLSQQATGADNAYNNLKINAEEKEKEALIVVEKSETLKKEIVDLDLEAKNTLAQAQKAEDGKAKDEITAQASALEGQKAQRQKNLDANEAKIKMLKNKAESLKQEAELVNDLVVQIKTPAETHTDVTSIDKKKLAQQVYTYESIDRAKQTDVLPGTKNTDSVNVISTEPSPSATDMEVQFNKSIVDAENISDNKEREIKKVEIYKQWESLIEEDLSVKKQKLISLSDENEKVKLTEEISKLNELSLEKEKLVRQGNANVEKLKTQEQLVKSDGNSLNVTNPDSMKVNNFLVKNDSTTINSDKKPNNKADIADEKITTKKDLPVVEGSLVKPETVLSQEAISELDKTKDISKEANDYSNLAIQEKKDAYNITNPQERAAAIETANNVEALAQSKQMEVNTVYANVNKAEFEKNQIGLDQLTQLSSKNDADDISVASMLNDESRFYFAKAQKSRESVNTTNNFSLKQDALKKANDDELLALERQKRARDIYMKYYPNFVASATPVKSDTLGLDSISLVKNDVISDSLKVLNPSAKVDSMGLIGNQQENKVQNVETATDSIAGNFASVEKKSTADVNAQVQSSKASDIGSDTKENKIAKTSGSKNNAPVLSAPERLEKIKNTQQYKNYTALKEEADGIWIQAKNEYKIADEYKNKASGDDKLSTALTLGLDSLPNDSLKKEAILRIQEYANQAKMNLSKADSVTELANNTQASANSKKMEADLFLQSLDMMEYEKETATGLKNSSPDISTSSNKIAKDTVQPIVEGFEKSPASVYSAANPIPININLPTGLIFKVQVGAFKNPIPQDLFQGMAPLSGETTPKGIIRYTAGMFKKFSKANAAKKEIVGFGYKDAFVVAFFDGKRIAINDAFAMVNKEEDNIEENISTNSVSPVLKNGLENGVNSQAFKNASENGVNANLPDTTISPVISNESISIAKAENLANIKGLIYTVQIGVYSRAVSTVQLFNIQPLYNEITPSGSIRYTSGAYNDVNKATEAKNSIVNIGVKDAFVTAYYNGKRISVLESTQLMFSKKESVLAKIGGMNVMPVRSLVSDKADDKVLKDAAKAASNDTSFVFKVQIGAFKEEVPIDIANKFLQITAKGINNYLDENGLTVYTAGSFKNYEAANELKNEVVTAGVVDAFVVVYKDGKKTSIEEAQKILNK